MERSTVVLTLVMVLSFVRSGFAYGPNFDYVCIVTDDAHTSAAAPTTPNGDSVNLTLQNNSSSTAKCYVYLKCQLPIFTGTVTGSVLELQTNNGSATGRTVTLYQTGNNQSDGVSSWTDSPYAGGSALIWNNQPAIGTSIANRIYPTDMLPALRGSNNSFQFSGVNLDSYINSVGSGGTISFVLVLSPAADSNTINFHGRGPRRGTWFDWTKYLRWATLNFNYSATQTSVSSFINKDVKVIQSGHAVWPDYFKNNNYIATAEAEVPFDGIQQQFYTSRGGFEAYDGYVYSLSSFLYDGYNVMKTTNFNRYTDNFHRFTVNHWGVQVGDMFSSTFDNSVLTNVRLASHVIKDNSAAGWTIDPENYNGYMPYSYLGQTGRGAAGRLFADYKVKARQRGKQYIQALQNELPHEPLYLLLYCGYSYTRSGITEGAEHGLWPAFLDGMIEGARPIDRIFDGNENNGTYTASGLMLWESYYQTKYGNKSNGLVAGDLQTKYDKVYKNSSANWIDQGTDRDTSTTTWYKDFNGVYGNTSTYIDPTKSIFWSPGGWGNAIQWGIYFSDRYIWAWGYISKWFNDDGKLNVPQAYRDALSRLIRKGKLERFDSQNLNLNVWERYNSTGSADSTFIQACRLSIDGTGKNADYTTKGIKISVGEKVTVSLSQVSAGSGGEAGLVLTNDSAQTAARTDLDTRRIGVYWWSDNSTITATKADSSGTTHTTLGTGVSTVGHNFEIERLSDTQATLSVYDGNNVLLNTQTLTFVNVPENLYISLVSNNAKFIFSNLWLISPYFEKFDGTAKNLDVWEQYGSDNIFSQNEDMTIDATAANADYTTQDYAIGIGDNITATVVPISTAASGTFGLYLTSNVNSTDNLTNGPTLNDTRYVGIRWSNSDKNMSAVKKDSGGTSQGAIQNITHPFYNTYFFQITRDNATKATMKLYNGNHNQLGTTQSLTLNDVPNKLYVSVVSNYAKTKFDFGPTDNTSLFTPIEGTVVLREYDPVDPNIPVSVRIELKQNGEIVRTDQQILGPNGEFLLTNVSPGQYTIGIKAATWLKKVVPITKTESTYNMDPVELINGDLRGDNEVGSTSLSIVLSQLGQMGDEW